MKVGVYVGSFNPVHKGHENIVEYLLKEKYLDKIIVIPTLNYWDKQNLLDLKSRTDMLKLTFNNNNVIIDNSLSKYEYTYKIMNYLKENYNDSFYLIIGADNMIDFNKWKNVSEILKNYVIVLNRNEINIDEYVSYFKEKDKFIIIKDYPYLDISSTQIREMLSKKETDNLEDLLNKKVIKYIKKNNLYMNGVKDERNS